MAAHHLAYVGSGPYCYSNSLAMMLGKNSPSPAVIEFAMSSPFGMQMIGSKLVFFDPFGWDPTSTVDSALLAAGWHSRLTVGRDCAHALASLTTALEDGAVFVGPVEMGHLRYQPGMNGPIGADHYVVVLRITDGVVELHDPHGFPYATIPVTEFMTAWKADSIPYGQAYMMRTDFYQFEDFTEEDIIRRSLGNARKWLLMNDAPDMPRGSVGNGEAAKRLASMIDAKLSPAIRGLLINFGVRVGARRLADAATCLSRVGHDHAADILATQARLVGSLQYLLMVGRNDEAATALRELAHTYGELETALDQLLS